MSSGQSLGVWQLPALAAGCVRVGFVPVALTCLQDEFDGAQYLLRLFSGEARGYLSGPFRLGGLRGLNCGAAFLGWRQEGSAGVLGVGAVGRQP